MTGIPEVLVLVEEGFPNTVLTNSISRFKMETGISMRFLPLKLERPESQELVNAGQCVHAARAQKIDILRRYPELLQMDDPRHVPEPFVFVMLSAKIASPAEGKAEILACHFPDVSLFSVAEFSKDQKFSSLLLDLMRKGFGSRMLEFRSFPGAPWVYYARPRYILATEITRTNSSIEVAAEPKMQRGLVSKPVTLSRYLEDRGGFRAGDSYRIRILTKEARKLSQFGRTVDIRKFLSGTTDYQLHSGDRVQFYGLDSLGSNDVIFQLSEMNRQLLLFRIRVSGGSTTLVDSKVSDDEK